MQNVSLSDTIAAIATPIGESGIGIVRLSGKAALPIADKIFVSKEGRKPSEFKTYTVHYGWIAGPEDSIIDEVILTVMRAPKSYTKEDIVEISCHGGIVALRRVLERVLENGCRLAEPGEFTKRAFLNGRIDLTQAEAVLDVIKAKTDSALKAGIAQLKGNLSRRINGIRQQLLDILSLLEANIDFPEEEINRVNPKDFLPGLNSINEDLNNIIAASKTGRIMREGISAVICGRPNVGKSSLLNALLKQERSIVTPVAGTTRDTIEEIIDIKGIPVRIVDTAGIIEPRDLIERKAVGRSKKYIDSADLIILVFDNSKKISKEDEVIIKRLKKKAIIAVINKIDLKPAIDREKISRRFSRVVELCARKMQNMGNLEDAIVGLVYKGHVKSSEPALVSNLRHIESIKKTQKLIAEVVNSIDNNKVFYIELITQDIRDALGNLDYILGKRFSDDLLDKIFNEFCIGK